MEIINVKPSGYCKGVIRAILIVKETIKKYPDKKIYVLGMLVHNKYVVEAFNACNVVTLDTTNKNKYDLIDEIKDGVIIFTAHGIDSKIKKYAQDKGLIVVDATCLDVLKIEEICRNYLNDNYDIIYIGKRNHPESEAILSLSDKVHLVTNSKDIDKLNISNQKILISNQTTMSLFDTENQIKEILKKYPKAIVAQEVCNATKQRQLAVKELKDVDCLIVVGDEKSNNTAQLASIGKENGIKTIIKVETAKQLINYDISNFNKIAITSGASTPAYLTNQVINYLKNDKTELNIEIDHILDL